LRGPRCGWVATVGSTPALDLAHPPYIGPCSTRWGIRKRSAGTCAVRLTTHCTPSGACKEGPCASLVEVAGVEPASAPPVNR